MNWDEEFIQLLDKYTPVNLWERFSRGTLNDEELLYLGLGISPEKLQALVFSFNDILDKNRNANNSKVKNRFYITVSDLGLCHTFGDLWNLMKKAINSHG